MTEYRYSPEDVLALVLDADGDYDDGLDAIVSAGIRGGCAEVELTSTGPDIDQRVTERFRVTVERIEDDSSDQQPPAGFPQFQNEFHGGVGSVTQVGTIGELRL